MQAILGLWKGIGFGFCEEACPRRALHPNYTMEGVNLAPMKEEKRLTFHSPILEAPLRPRLVLRAVTFRLVKGSSSCRLRVAETYTEVCSSGFRPIALK